MTIRLKDKQAIVAEVNEVAQNALSAVIADYRNVPVSQMTELRQRARNDHVYLRVVRNTLARRALKGTDLECLHDVLVGPIILAFSQEDPGAAARLMQEFTKEYKQLEVKALSIGGKLLPAEQIKVLATMPTLDQARAMLMGLMLAPITKLARTFKEIPATVTRACSAVADEKQKTS